MPSFQSSDLATKLNGQLVGPGDLTVIGIEQVDLARPGQLTFVGDEKYAPLWASSKAIAVITTSAMNLTPGEGRALILVKNVDLATANALHLFAPPKVAPKPGIHPAAVVDPTATLGRDVAIGPGCVVGAHVSLGDGCILHANVTVMDHTTVGSRTELYPGVVVRDRCSIGALCIIHPNAVIGADGFGYRPSDDPAKPGIVKIPQIGTVVIGNDVEIGAGTCIDRGKCSATTVGDGTKIDNMVQVGHNVRIGRCCIICGQCGIAGSTVLEDGVTLGGKVAVKDHITIGRGATIAATAAIMGDVPPGVTWGGYPARDMRTALREHAAVRKLPDLIKEYTRAQRG